MRKYIIALLAVFTLLVPSQAFAASANGGGSWGGDTGSSQGGPDKCGRPGKWFENVYLNITSYSQMYPVQVGTPVSSGAVGYGTPHIGDDYVLIRDWRSHVSTGVMRQNGDQWIGESNLKYSHLHESHITYSDYRVTYLNSNTAANGCAVGYDENNNLTPLWGLIIGYRGSWYMEAFSFQRGYQIKEPTEPTAPIFRSCTDPSINIPVYKARRNVTQVSDRYSIEEFNPGPWYKIGGPKGWWTYFPAMENGHVVTKKFYTPGASEPGSIPLEDPRRHCVYCESGSFNESGTMARNMDKADLLKYLSVDSTDPDANYVYEAYRSGEAFANGLSESDSIDSILGKTQNPELTAALNSYSGDISSILADRNQFNINSNATHALNELAKSNESYSKYIPASMDSIQSLNREISAFVNINGLNMSSDIKAKYSSLTDRLKEAYSRGQNLQSTLSKSVLSKNLALPAAELSQEYVPGFFSAVPGQVDVKITNVDEVERATTFKIINESGAVVSEGEVLVPPRSHGPQTLNFDTLPGMHQYKIKFGENEKERPAFKVDFSQIGVTCNTKNPGLSGSWRR